VFPSGPALCGLCSQRKTDKRIYRHPVIANGRGELEAVVGRLANSHADFVSKLEHR